MNGVRAIGLVVLLVAFAAACRLVPHGDYPNVAPVAAVALFAGWMIRSRVLAAAAPVGAMLVSDAVIGGYSTAVMATVYASLAAPVLIGRWVGLDSGSRARVLGRAACGSVASSILFFLTTNFAHWLVVGGYARTAAGLVECYAAALPFFKYTAAGDLAFTAVLFGGWLLVARRSLARTVSPAPVLAPAP